MTMTRKEPLILVINASQAILNLYYDALEEQGYEIELSSYTFETLETVERLQPDLIILAFDQEGQRAEWEWLTMLKLYSPTANIPVLLCLLPLPLHLDGQAHFQRNAIHLLYTPFRKEELLSAVHQLLAAIPMTQLLLWPNSNTHDTEAI